MQFWMSCKFIWPSSFQTWNLSLSPSLSLALPLSPALSCSISGEFFWNIPRKCCRFIRQQHQTRPRVEGIISAADRLVRRHLTIRLDTMLQAEKLPASIADLHTWLAIGWSDPKIAGKWMFIPLKMVLIGIDPYPFWNSGCLDVIRLRVYSLRFLLYWALQQCVGHDRTFFSTRNVYGVYVQTLDARAPMEDTRRFTKKLTRGFLACSQGLWKVCLCLLE